MKPHNGRGRLLIVLSLLSWVAPCMALTPLLTPELPSPWRDLLPLEPDASGAQPARQGLSLNGENPFGLEGVHALGLGAQWESARHAGHLLLLHRDWLGYLQEQEARFGGLLAWGPWAAGLGGSLKRQDWSQGRSAWLSPEGVGLLRWGGPWLTLTAEGGPRMLALGCLGFWRSGGVAGLDWGLRVESVPSFHNAGFSSGLETCLWHITYTWSQGAALRMHGQFGLESLSGRADGLPAPSWQASLQWPWGAWRGLMRMRSQGLLGSTLGAGLGWVHTARPSLTSSAGAPRNP